MAGSLQSRIQVYTGTIIDTTNLTDLINASIRSLINIIPESKAERYASASTDSGSGIDISSIRPLRAHKNGYHARLIDAGLKIQALPSGAISSVEIVDGGTGYSINDVLTLTTGGSSGTCKVLTVSAGVVTSVSILTVGTGYSLGISNTTVAPSGGSGCVLYVIPTNGSLHQATNTDPIWYIEATKVYILPSGGTLIGLGFPPGINYISTTISGFPLELEQAVIVDVAIQELLYKTNLAYDSLTSFSMDSVTVPTPPSSASYSYSDATLGTYSSTTIGNLPTSPSYTPPTCSLTVAPSNLDISSVAPTTPNVPSYSYADASLGTFSSTTIGSLGTLPTYTKPTISLTTAPDDLDLSSITVPTPPSDFSLSVSATPPAVPSAPSISYADAAIGAFDSIVIDPIPTPPTYTKPENGIDFVNTIIYIDSKQDLERANSEISHQALAATSYDKDMQNELNEFNSQIENQKLSVQHIIRQAELLQQTMLDKSKAQTDLNIQNAIQTMNALVTDYQAVLNKYNNDLTRYQQIVNAEVNTYSTNLQKYAESLNTTKISIDKAVQEYRANLELWQNKRQTELSQYSYDIQNEQNEFQKELSIYQSTVQNAIRQAELDQERLILNASKTTDLNLQNKAQTLSASINLYKDTLQKFNEDISLYQNKVNTEVNEYKSNLDKWTIDRQTQLGLYSADIQNATNSFNVELAVFNAGIQKLLEQSRLDQERVLATANKTTDLDVINEAKKLDRQIAEYQDNLQLYSAKVNSYGVQVNEASQKYSLGINKILGQIQSMNNIIEQCRKEYQRIVSML